MISYFSNNLFNKIWIEIVFHERSGERLIIFVIVSGWFCVHMSSKISSSLFVKVKIILPILVYIENKYKILYLDLIVNLFYY